jgi:hypothetical protein
MLFFQTGIFRGFSLYISLISPRGGRVAQRSFLRVDEPKQTVARKARARSVANPFKEHIFKYKSRKQNNCSTYFVSYNYGKTLHISHFHAHKFECILSIFKRM